MQDYPDDTWEVQNEYHQKRLNQTIPPSDEYDYDRCHVYLTDHVVYDNSTNIPLNATKHECSEWVYDTTVFYETFTSKVFSDKNSDIFHISAQNIDCGYSLESPRKSGV